MASVDILIADDHELFRRTLRSFIESHSEYRICGEAGDGVEAVEKVRQFRPQVVLMDINMPRMDGLEATKIIRRELPDCHVIVVTQNDVTIAREQARTVNAHGLRYQIGSGSRFASHHREVVWKPTDSSKARTRRCIYTGGRIGRVQEVL